MQLKRNYYENLEIPDFVLCKANRERIGIIPCTEKTVDFNFGEMDEISFKTYYMIDGDKNPVYSEIEVMKYVLVPNIGFYYIQSCTTESEGTDHEYKNVKGQSIEGLLGQKYLENFLINTGETGSKELEFDSTGNTQIHIYLTPTQKTSGKMDLFDYVLEKCPDWYVAYCDPALLEDDRSHRSFDVDRQDVYSFIINDIQDAFECYAIFDTVNLDNKGRSGIYLYAQENYLNDTDIYVSYDNLLQSTNISTNTDDIKTCVVLKGQDELEVREVNFGYDRLYNFDYYNNTKFWSQDLYNEYNEWYDKTYDIGRIIYQKLSASDVYDSSITYYIKSDSEYTEDTTVTAENFEEKVAEGLYVFSRNPNVYTEDLTDEDLANMSFLDLYQYRLNRYLEERAKLDKINTLSSDFVNDDDRGIGSGEFPVFDNDGNEIGSIKFDIDVGVRVTTTLPSSPYNGEQNYLYIIKKINSPYDLPTLRFQSNILTQGKNIQIENKPPIPIVWNDDIYRLQNEFYDITTSNRKNIVDNLKNFAKGGSVDLVLRPIVDEYQLELAGWGKQDFDIATLFIHTYSNSTNTIAMNFTPIRSDAKGTCIGILSPQELQNYANKIIRQYETNKKHTYNDNYKLKIGATYTGGSCVYRAKNDAEQIQDLNYSYYHNGAYWPLFEGTINYDRNRDYSKVKNPSNLIKRIENELYSINQYLKDYDIKYRYNQNYHHSIYKLDADKYNDAKKREKLLTELRKNLIKWIPDNDRYFINTSIAQSLINYSNVYSSLLVASSNPNLYKIPNLGLYQNQLNKDIDTVNNLIEVTIANSSVSYPAYQIYRWFDNTNTRTFYNALVSADATFKETGTISVADARVLRNEEFGNPLYNTCYNIIEGTNTVVITDVDAFQEYLAEDLEEQTALITKFPNSAWFNTNSWQGYGYSELTDTWALSLDQILSTMSKNNWGTVPAASKTSEIDPTDYVCQATSAEDDPYNYFGNYLPAYLTQLAIEEKIASLDKQINGYDTYPYSLTSKGSLFFEKLPSIANQGDTYTISNSFTIDNVTYPSGTNVTWNGSEWVVTESLKTHINGIQDDIDTQSLYKSQVVNEVALDNNLSEPCRIELSTFIREEELSSDNFLVTDTMTEEERAEMLQSFVEYGEKELSKISVPQLTFSANIVNLFSIPEFDGLSEDFEPGKSIYVSIRDDYHVKAMLLNVHINYYDPTDFSMRFSDVLKKNEGLYTHLQDAINTATSAATSVALGSSTWSAGAATATKLNTSLEEGLLSQGAYLSDSPSKSTFEISDIGIFIDTADGDYGRYDVFGEEKFVYDSIYLGGGRILFTDDGWKHVRMSLGRSQVTRISPDNQYGSTAEEFGVFADFVISGYVEGSEIVGGELFSRDFTTDNNGNSVPISYWNLNSGNMTIYSTNGGKPLFDFSGAKLTINGEINATSGKIGGFTINENSLTGGNVVVSPTQLKYGSKFSVASDGKLTATDGYFTGTINGGSININNQFIVDSYGNFKATSAEINGSITSGSTISGSTISGSTISGGSITGTSISTSNIYIYNKLNLLDTDARYGFYVTPLTSQGSKWGTEISSSLPIYFTSDVTFAEKEEFLDKVIFNDKITLLTEMKIDYNADLNFYCPKWDDKGNLSDEPAAIYGHSANTLAVSSTVSFGYNDTGKLRAAITNTSDLRYKNILDDELNFAESFIMNIKPISYTWEDENDDGQIHMGFGAQQIYEILQDLELHGYAVVDKPQNEEYTRWGIVTHELIPPLVKVVQDHNNEIQALKDQIKELEYKIERIK